MKKMICAPLCAIALSMFLSQMVVAQLPGLIPYRKGTKWGFADSKKTILIEPVYDSVAVFSEGRAAVMKARKWGYIDEAGKEITPIQYQKAYVFRNKSAIVSLVKNGSEQWGCIDYSGNPIVEPQYQMISQASKGLYYVRDKKLCGLLSAAGVEIAKPIYNNIFEFENGVARFEIGKKFGFIDSTGKEILKPDYYIQGVKSFSNGLGLVEAKDFSGKTYYYYVNRKGEKIHQIQKYFLAESFSEGAARVIIKNGDDYISTCIDTSGTPLFGNKEGVGIYGILPSAIIFVVNAYPPGYISGKDIIEDALQEVTSKYGVMDRKGNVIEKAENERIEWLIGDWVSIKKDGMWQIFNVQTRKFAGQKYDAVRMDDLNNFIQVKNGNKWGTIDGTGKLWFAPKYDSVGYNDRSYCIVGNGGKYTYVDNTGKEIFPVKYRMVFGMYEGSGFFVQNNLAGIVSSKGKEIVPPKYYVRSYKPIYGEEMLLGYYFTNGIALVSLNGRGGYVDYTGKEYWED